MYITACTPTKFNIEPGGKRLVLNMSPEQAATRHAQSFKHGTRKLFAFFLLMLNLPGV